MNDTYCKNCFLFQQTRRDGERTWGCINELTVKECKKNGDREIRESLGHATSSDGGQGGR